jgi:hypothetical protein
MTTTSTAALVAPWISAVAFHGGVEPIEARTRRQRTASTTRHGRTIKSPRKRVVYLQVDGGRFPTEHPSVLERFAAATSRSTDDDDAANDEANDEDQPATFARRVHQA